MRTSRSILVTGANGFIGSRLVRLLADTSWDVTTLYRGRGADLCADLLDINVSRDALQGRMFDAVVHLASPARGKNTIESQIDECVAIENLISALDTARGSALLYFSSADEYRGGPEPLDEFAPLDPMTSYGIAKMKARQTAQRLSDNRDVSFSVFRPFNVYGEGQPAAMLISYLISGALRHEILRISQNDKMRDYVHVDDVCRAVINWLEAGCVPGIFNIGSGRAIKTSFVLSQIEHLMGARIRVQKSPGLGQGDPDCLIANADLARSKLKWRAKVPLEEGLAALFMAHASRDGTLVRD